MASEAQIAANRRNGAKSTGPRTARGKTAVGRNALRHGLTAERVVCFDETEADFAAFAASAPDMATDPENYETKPIFRVKSEGDGDKAEAAAPITDDAEPCP